MSKVDIILSVYLITTGVLRVKCWKTKQPLRMGKKLEVIQFPPISSF